MTTHVTAAADLSDPDFVERLRRGDDAAFETLVTTCAGRLLAVARRFLRNDEDARDAVQEAFIQAFKALPAFEARCALSTWLHSITVRACLMKLRQGRSQSAKNGDPQTSIEDWLPQFDATGHRVISASRRETWDDGATAAVAKESRALIRECIEKLPEDYRNIIVLRDIEEMDTRAVADLLEISESLVKTRLHRARQALRTLLEPLIHGASL